MKTTMHIAIAGASLALAAPSALSQIQFVSQDRTVTVGSLGPESTFSTSALGLFDEVAVPDASNQNLAGSVIQTSFLSVSEISGSGAVLRNDLTNGISGQSTMDIVFTISTPTEYTFMGTVPGGAASEGSAGVLLTGPDDFETGLGLFLINDPPQSLDDFEVVSSIQETAILQPGEYTIRAFAQTVDLIQDEFGGQFDFSITFVPAPGGAALLVAGGLFGWRRRRA